MTKLGDKLYEVEKRALEAGAKEEAEVCCRAANELDRLENESKKQAEKINKAIELAVAYGGIDGGHHKDWVIDQMVRALTACPTVKRTAIDCKGVEYSYDVQGESEEYRKIVADACDGEDGPDTYSWDEGVPP